MIEEYRSQIPLSILENAQKELKNHKLTKKQEKEFFDKLLASVLLDKNPTSINTFGIDAPTKT